MYTLGGGIIEDQGWGRGGRLSASGPSSPPTAPARTRTPSVTGTSPPTSCAANCWRTATRCPPSPRCFPGGGSPAAAAADVRTRSRPTSCSRTPAAAARGPLPGVVGALARRDARGGDHRVRCRAGPAGAPGVLDAIGAANVVLFPPSNPVVSIGTIRPYQVSGPRSRPRPWSACRASSAARRCRDGRRLPDRDRGGHLGRRGRRHSAPGSGGWLVDDQDKAAGDDRALAGIGCAQCRCTCATCPPRRRSPAPRWTWPRASERQGSAPVTVFRSPGSRDHRGADLAALIAEAARPARRRHPRGHLQDREQGRGPGGHRLPRPGHRGGDGARGRPPRPDHHRADPDGLVLAAPAWTSPTPPRAPSCCCPRTRTSPRGDTQSTARPHRRKHRRARHRHDGPAVAGRADRQRHRRGRGEPAAGPPR